VKVKNIRALRKVRNQAIKIQGVIVEKVIMGGKVTFARTSQFSEIKTKSNAKNGAFSIFLSIEILTIAACNRIFQGKVKPTNVFPCAYFFTYKYQPIV